MTLFNRNDKSGDANARPQVPTAQPQAVQDRRLFPPGNDRREIDAARSAGAEQGDVLSQVEQRFQFGNDQRYKGIRPKSR